MNRQAGQTELPGDRSEDVIYEARDGYKRRFGRSGTEIMEYLHQIGKRMGCEDFQW
jgi:hypothetical protein